MSELEFGDRVALISGDTGMREVVGTFVNEYGKPEVGPPYGRIFVKDDDGKLWAADVWAYLRKLAKAEVEG